MQYSAEFYSIDMNGLRHSAKGIAKASEKHPNLIPVFFWGIQVYRFWCCILCSRHKTHPAHFLSLINNYNGNVIGYVHKD